VLLHPEARVDLFAAILARISEREQSLGADLRIAIANDTVADREVVVLDDDVRLPGAPIRIPGAHVLAAERAFDPRTAHGTGHVAVEFTAAAEVHCSGTRSEIGQDSSEHLVAFLPVVADDVEVEGRLVTIPGGAA